MYLNDRGQSWELNSTGEYLSLESTSPSGRITGRCANAILNNVLRHASRETLTIITRRHREEVIKGLILLSKPRLVIGQANVG